MNILEDPSSPDSISRMSGSGDAADTDHHTHGHVGGVQVGKPHQEVDPRRNIAKIFNLLIVFMRFD